MARYLGIDIGEHALRGVLVRSALRKLEVERYVEIPLTAASGAPDQAPELASAGHDLLRALPASPDMIVAAMPGEEISLRLVELPTSARKRIHEILPFELETMLPYEPREAVIDHQPVDASAGVVRVLAAAALRDRVAAQLRELTQAGLEPRELAAGAAALDGLVNLLPELKVEGPVLLVELGDRRTDVCVLKGGHCAGARTIGLGIADMPKAAQNAERELARTVASFRTTGLPSPVVAYACGTGAAAEGALPWLERALNVPVKPLPLPDPSLGGTPPSPALSKAAALAARAAAGRHRINLRTGEFTATHARSQLVDHLNMIAACAVVVVLCAMFALKARQKMLEDENLALQTELAAATKDVFDKPISDASQAEALIKNPRASDPLPRFDAYDALAALSGSIGTEISHEVRRLSIEVADEKREGRVELQGALGSLAQRDDVVAQLQKHPCFHQIELGRTSPAAGQDSSRINYQIEASLQCPGEGNTQGKGNKSAKAKQEIDR
jgi:general secretion pathway protein L